MPNITTTVDNSSPLFQWVPPSSWAPGSSRSDPGISFCYKGTSMFTNVSGAYVTFKFFGNHIQIYGSKRKNHGMYQVRLDDVLYDPVDGSQSSSGKFQQVLFSADGLLDAAHVLMMKNLDNNKYLDIDYATWYSNIGDPAEEIIVRTIQDTNPDIQYKGVWNAYPQNLGTFFGGTGRVSITPGSSFEYSFTGSAVSLFGPSDPQGSSYSVGLDDEVPQNFTFRSLQYVPNSMLYFRGGLTTGKRKIKVTHTGAEGNMLAIDYINVFTTPSIEQSIFYGLPSSAKAGIAVGTLTFLALFLISLYYCTRHEKSPWDQSEGGLGRLLDKGWWKIKSIAKGIIKSVKTGRRGATEKIDLTGDTQYGGVRMSGHESEYLIPNFGPPGIGETTARQGGDLEGNVQGDELGRLHVHFEAFSDPPRCTSTTVGDTRHSHSKSLSGTSVMNQPLVGFRNPFDTGFSGVPGNCMDSKIGGNRSQSQVPNPSDSSGISETPTPSTATIDSGTTKLLSLSISTLPKCMNGSDPRSGLQSPSDAQPLFSGDAGPERVITHHSQSISEPGPSKSPRIQNHSELERKRTFDLPLSPGATRPVAPTNHEPDEFGAITNRPRTGSVSSLTGNRGNGVIGPRPRALTGQRMSISGMSGALPPVSESPNQSDLGATAGVEALSGSEKSAR